MFKKILVSALLLSGLACAQGSRYDSNSYSVSGINVIAVSGAGVTVCASPATGQTATTPCTNVVTVYSDQALTQQITQPIITDAGGNFGFFAASGTYQYSLCRPALLGCSGPYTITLPAVSGGAALFSSITATGSVSVGGNETVTGSFSAGSFNVGLGVFASTTSAQLAGVISDETGTGPLVFATSPAITAPVIASITGTAGNPVSIKGGAAASNDLVVTNAANTSNLLTVTDSAGNVILGKAGAVIQIPGSSSQAVNLQASATAGNGTISLPAITTSDTLAALAFPQTLTNKTLTSPAVTNLTDTGTSSVKRVRSNQGSSVVSGDFSISGGWGSTASISSVGGTDTAGTISIASAGTGQGANPTFTLTFHDGAFPSVPIVMATRGDVQTSGHIAVTSVSTTAVTFTVNHTPTAGQTYVFFWWAVAR